MASFFLVILLFREPAKGVLVTLNVVIGSILLKVIQIHAYGHPAFISFEQGVQTNVANISEAIFAINNNVPSYMIGLLLGHFMMKDVKILPKFTPFAWILVSHITGLTVIAAFITLSLPFEMPSNIQSFTDQYIPLLSRATQNEAPYWLKVWIGSTIQTAVSLCFALFSYLCYNESRHVSDEIQILPLFNQITRLVVCLFSCKLFVILGRISLPMIMSHYLIIQYMLSVPTDAVPTDIGEVVLRAPFVFFMSTFFGIIIHITFESPFKNVLNLLTSRSKEHMSGEKSNNDIDNTAKNIKTE